MSTKKSKKPTFSVDDVGQMGGKIYNDLMTTLEFLVPIKGKIVISTKLLLKDDNVFKDDELREAQITIEIDLAPKEIK